MTLTKNGQVINLDNENHIEAFKASGWAEVKTPAAASPVSEEAKADEPMNEPIVEEKAEPKATKRPAGRRKQEK